MLTFSNGFIFLPPCSLDLLYHKQEAKNKSIVNFRFEYLRRDVVQLYSGIGVGATERHDESYVVALPMIDVTYLGVTVGRNIYGFAELGGGINGCIRVGMGYKF